MCKRSVPEIENEFLIGDSFESSASLDGEVSISEGCLFFSLGKTKNKLGKFGNRGLLLNPSGVVSGGVDISRDGGGQLRVTVVDNEFIVGSTVPSSWLLAHVLGNAARL